MRTIIAFLGAAIVAITITACAAWQPFYEPSPASVSSAALPLAASPPAIATPSPSAIPVSAAVHRKDPPHPAPSAVTTPAIITDSSPEQRGAAAKLVAEVSASVGRIDRSRLSEADAESYDLAVNLLASARRSLANRQYHAAASLSQKASVLIGTILVQ